MDAESNTDENNLLTVEGLKADLERDLTTSGIDRAYDST